MDKDRLAELLEDIGTLLELKGENPFKVRAYHNAARAIGQYQGPLEKAVKEGALSDIPGIGKGLSERIEEFSGTGHIKYYDELKSAIPPGMIEMLSIEGLGPRKIRAIHEKLGIDTVRELEEACRKNKIASLDGFGNKTQENILKGIQYLSSNQNKFLISDALREALRILGLLKKKCKGNIKRIEIAGSLRRKKELIGDIDFVASAPDPKKVMDVFASLEGVKDVIAKGSTKTSVKLDGGINADIRIVSDREFPYALHHFTGSKEHNTAMRALAKTKSMKMNEYGLFRKGRNVPCRNEKDIFDALGLSFIPPELREDRGEIEAASRGGIPRLVEEKDIKGVLHVHTSYSDGSASLEKMVAETKKRGYSYVGICDHSESAYYAGGLDESKLRKQWAEIDALNAEDRSFRIFKGIEVDIFPDGKIDYDERVLEKFDFVIASIHTKFKMTKEDMTERIIKAVKNPYTTMIGHLTGRLLLTREGYEVDIERIIEVCASEGKTIELNSHPQRLDLDWRFCKLAKERGVPISVNPDAHNAEGLDDITYGIGAARKGWLEKKDILNTRTAGELKKFFDKIKK
ncbi:MAG: DNA polymerase/3'-5' exonuclease PolX [Candidatus Aureabacteria bacterium]|nr:DNA polymerase/3'-5' exonuclease PolX [Candidatus Auribacterota bacterium]